MASLIYLIGMKHCGKTTLGRAASRALRFGFSDLDQLLLDWYRAGSDRAGSDRPGNDRLGGDRQASDQASDSEAGNAPVTGSRPPAFDTGSAGSRRPSPAEQPSSVREIYRRHGAEEFRRFEAEAAAWFLRRRGGAGEAGSTDEAGGTAEAGAGRADGGTGGAGAGTGDTGGDVGRGAPDAPPRPPSGRASHIVALGGGAVENQRLMEAVEGSGLFVYLRAEAETLFARIRAGGLPPFLDTEDPWHTFLALYRRRVPLYEHYADVTVDVEGMSVEQATDRLIRSIEEQHYAG
jgi:shikimate kinase